MSRHLSSEQISRWAMGQHEASDQEHVRDCPQCRAAVERLESMLAQFGGSVRRWSDRHAGPAYFRPAPDASHRAGRWVLAAAALLVLVTVPAYQNRERKREAEQAQADALLMERVDRAISRTVPRPMEPLEEMMTGAPGYPEGNEKRP